MLSRKESGPRLTIGDGGVGLLVLDAERSLDADGVELARHGLYAGRRDHLLRRLVYLELRGGRLRVWHLFDQADDMGHMGPPDGAGEIMGAALWMRVASM